MEKKETCLWCNRKDNKESLVDNATKNDGFSLWYHENCLGKLKDKTGQ
ncbi:hypothetical protein [Lysinibacillus sp. BPa_S21]|nr:hypothetical protein [Lysinibacillus sp. BPa_S21]MCL1696308.1 hypothetical protein [Lysinibacillus sp. BPa_S21]